MSARFDWTDTFKKISTWLGILSAAASSGLLAYATMPERVQNLMPDAILLALGACAVGPALLVGAATAYKQSGLGRYSKVEVKTTTKVEGDISQEDAVRIAEAVSPTQENKDVRDA